MRKERERGKGTDTKQMEQKKSDQHLACLQAMAALKAKTIHSSYSNSFFVSMTSCEYETSLWPVWSISPSCVPCQPFTHSCLIGREQSRKRRKPWHCVKHSLQASKHWCVTNTALATNPKIWKITSPVRHRPSVSDPTDLIQNKVSFL